MEEEKQKINDRKIYDKTLPPHNFITLELCRRKFLKKESDLELYLFDDLFENVLKEYDFKTVIVAVSYIVSRVKSHHFLDEDGKEIECLYAYFRTALLWDLKKITGQIRLSWMDDDQLLEE